ncbi:MAG: glycerol kinase GlpK [Lachnospiraceae bacterium]|nr:glycerol kinase GlpK [Lachnospiraceae bacterium]
MGKKYVMALDQGTTSSRCILFRKDGSIASVAQKEFPQIYPKAGYVEHNPMDIWSSQISVAVEALAQIGASAEEISAIGITNQRETTLVWDKKTGQPIYNAIVWQCRRTADMIEQLKKDGMEEKIRQKTGLIPDAYFSATKLKWMLEQVPGAMEAAQRGELLFGTVDTWLIWNLTRGRVHVTDYTNASRTMLFDIHKLCWDKEILDYFGIPESLLPQVKPSSCVYGMTDAALFGGEIPIAGVAGDQQAALFGQCCFEAGEVKNTYGTGCFLLMNTGEKLIESKNRLLTTIAASTGEKPNYALEGSIFVAGAAIQWLRDEQGLIPSAAESEAAAMAVEDTADVYVVPAFTGIGAPYWNSYARGTIVGITRGFNRNHMIRATLESLAYQTNDVLRAMEQDSGISIKSLRVDGGASANNFLMQFQSDILDTIVHRPKCIETTALGAAYLAGIATGYWNGIEEIRENWVLDRTFLPQLAQDKRTEKLKGWQRAVRCALAWAEDRDDRGAVR